MRYLKLRDVLRFRRALGVLLLLLVASPAAVGAILPPSSYDLPVEPQAGTEVFQATPVPGDDAIPVGAGQTLDLFQIVRPSPIVLESCQALGFEPIPLITQWRFFDAGAGTFDYLRYVDNIWTPELDPYPGYGTWEKHGIPYGFTVWADLDFEEWDPILHPEDYPPGHIYARFQDYMELIAATRQLRPQAKVCLHGLVRGPLQGTSGGLIETIVSQCDAISPAMYSNFTPNFTNLQQQLNIKRDRILACLQLKADHGVKVYPVVSKRYQLLHPDGTPVLDNLGRRIVLLAPAPVLELMMQLIFTTELDGLRVDGIIVWSQDNVILHARGEHDTSIPDTFDQRAADLSEIAFLEIIIEFAELHFGN